MSLYEKLNVNSNASTKEIKAAYKALAKEHHPDKGGNPEKFKEIAEAYRILGDEVLREKYDNGADLETVKAEANGFLHEVFVYFQRAIMDRGFVPEHTDLFAIMREVVNEDDRKLGFGVETIDKEIRNLTEVQKRLRGADTFVLYLDSVMDTMKKERVKKTERQELLQRILDFTRNMEYVHEPDEEGNLQLFPGGKL